MTSKNYLGVLALTATLGWLAAAIIIYRLDPFISTALAVPFLFLALFLAGAPTLALVGFYGRVWFRRGEIYRQHISIALRQGVLITLAAEIALALQIFRVLTWWDGALLAAAVGLIEIYLSSRD